MLLFCNLLLGVAFLLGSLLTLFWWILIIYFVASWFSPDPNNQIFRFIKDLSEAIIAPMRRFVPPMGIFDMASLVTLLLLSFLDILIVDTLQEYGQNCKFGATTTVSETISETIPEY